MKKSLIVWLILGIFVFPCAAIAVPYDADWEFSLGGSGSSDRSFDTTVFSTEFFFKDSEDTDEAYKDGRFVYFLSIGFRF